MSKNRSKRKRTFTVLCGMAFVLALAGCGGNGSGSGGGEAGEAKDAPLKAPEPVTLKLATAGNIFSEEEFVRYVREPVMKKHPHITLEYINMLAKGSEIQNLVAAKLIPDIVVNYGSTLAQSGSTSLKDLGLLYNMDGVIKENAFALSRVMPETLEFVRKFAGTDYLPGLPAYNNAFGLFYNKTLFDRFAQAYPTDGMTWEQIGDIGKKITRFDNGVQYRGLYPDGITRMQRQFGLTALDQNGKSRLLSDEWKSLINLYFGIYAYSGNTDAPFDKDFNYAANQTAFFNGQLAMLAGYSNTLFELRKQPHLDWNLVTYPQYKGNLGYGSSVDVPVMSITAQSQFKQDAFRVIETVLSDEVQLDLARNGRMSVLVSDIVRQQFGAGIPELAGKGLNLSAMTKLKLTVPPIEGKYWASDTNAVLTGALTSILKKEKDINTAMREADEQINKLVEQKKNQ